MYVLPSDVKLHSVLNLLELAWQIESGKPANMGGSAKKAKPKQKKKQAIVQYFDILSSYTVYIGRPNTNWYEQIGKDK